MKNLSDGDTLTISVDGNDVTINIDSSYDDKNKLEKIADVLNDDSNVNQNFQAFAIDYNSDDKEDVITIVSKDSTDSFDIDISKNGGSTTTVNSESLNNMFDAKDGNDYIYGGKW